MPGRVRPVGLSDIATLPHTCPDCDRILPRHSPPDWARDTVRAWGQLGWRLVGPPVPTRAALVGASVLGSPVDGHRRGRGGRPHNGDHPDAVHAHRAGRLDTTACVLVAPACSRPTAGPLATAPVSPDAAVLVSLRLPDELRGVGLGRRLVQASAALALRHGCRGLEAVGTRGQSSCCQLDVDWLLSVGFQITRDHPLTPRLRMDLAATLPWRVELDAAWQRITDLVTPTPPPEVVRVASRTH